VKVGDISCNTSGVLSNEERGSLDKFQIQLRHNILKYSNNSVRETQVINVVHGTVNSCYSNPDLQVRIVWHFYDFLLDLAIRSYLLPNVK
jgi:hypothetical protein